MQSTRVVAFSVKGGGLNEDRLHPFGPECFRISAAVTYTCGLR